jgi:ElaB/YqjD/DUF883 family membrane-anchored ribosome-binding protein
MADNSKTSDGPTTIDATDTLIAEPPLKTTGAGADKPGGHSDEWRAAAGKLKDEAGKLGKQAADKARGYADEGKARATGALDEFAKMMSEAADTVDDRLGEQYGRYARSAADSLAGFADSLKGKDVDELMDDARDFVRKSPAVAIGTAAALGFVLARLIKSGVDAAADLADPDNDNADGKS